MTFIADRYERLDVFLARQLPQYSRSKLAKSIEKRNVLVDGKVAKPSTAVEPGASVELVTLPAQSDAHNLAPCDIPLDVVFEDDHLLVVNKPRGLATHPAESLHEPTLVNALLGRSQALSAGSAPFRPGIVHRLDKETTGLILIAKTDEAHWKLAKQIEAKTAERRYVAIVQGELEQESFRIGGLIGRDPKNRLKMAMVAEGKSAATLVRRIARVDAGTLIALRLETGRTHQIRVHMLAVGHPVVGDRLYSGKPNDVTPMQLHAAYLAFDHPSTGERIALFQAPPDDFLARAIVMEEHVSMPFNPAS